MDGLNGHLGSPSRLCEIESTVKVVVFRGDLFFADFLNSVKIELAKNCQIVSI